MIGLRVVGIDPGPIPGIVILDYADGSPAIDVVQCSSRTAPTVLAALLEDRAVATLVQIERFVVGRRAGRSSTPGAGETTRNLVGALREVWEDFDSTADGRLGGRWFERSASAVKPWATDIRLAQLGLLEPTKGMGHARDAARHALFAACHDGGIPDPLSTRSKA